MALPESSKPKAAYMYEVDDDDRRIEGTKKSAKQRSTKVHRTADRLEKPEERRISKSDTGPQHEAMMSGARVDPPEGKLERRKSSASTKSPRKTQTRTQSSQATKYPKISIPTDHPSHFGISTSTPTAARAPPVVVSQYTYPIPAPIPLRPRATTTQTYPAGRPVSYHAAYTSAGYATGPPIAHSAYFQHPAMSAPSYPPASPSASYMRYAVTPQPEYFPPQPLSGRPLAQRFESPVPRTSSAMAMREVDYQQQLQDAYEDGYASASERPRRGSSIRLPSSKPRTITQKELDFTAMPPPPLPGILRNRNTEYHADIAPNAPRESRTAYRDDPPSRRPSTHRNSVSYDLPDEVRVETANTSHRRQSYYGQSASTAANPGTGTGLGWEEKLREAAGYQEDVGGPTAPLSAESLRRHQRRQAGSTRSTKSSGSRDESDYRKSATTHTSQSGRANDEDFTIKVKGGQARIMVGGAQIDCTEGGEVEVKRQKSLRNGSERSASNYGDDRRSRTERTTGRSRMSSQSGRSYERPTPRYDAQENFF